MGIIEEDMIMNKNYIYTILFSVSIMTTFGCVDENFDDLRPGHSGNDIFFGARAGIENADSNTKTSYAGENSYYTDNGLRYERIDWAAGDNIEIYCAEAVNGPTSHYAVTSADDNSGEKADYATLSRHGSDGLQWGTGKEVDGTTGVHDFYAMYPSSTMFDLSAEPNLAQGVKMEGTIIKGIVPLSQTPARIIPEGNNYVLEPDMRYAYMAAKSTGVVRYDKEGKQNGVSLSFVPIVTALKVELKLPEMVNNAPSLGINVANIYVQGKGIAGSFSCSLENWNRTKAPVPACLNSPEATDNITISTWQTDESGKQVPLQIAAGATLTFTVFLLPGADIENIKIGFSDGSAGEPMGKNLTGLVIPKQKKTVIKNLHLPAEGFEFKAENWMTQLAPETEFNRLSIPGASGAFTQAGSSDSRSQELTFTQLWDVGIRAFEISTDRKQSNFANEPVTCNSKNISGVTVSSVLREITGKLSNSNECAILIFTYQPTGDSNYPRDPAAYVEKVCTYFSNNYNSYLEKFRPTLTLGEAKGKLIVIIRPSQIDEDTLEERTAALTAANNSQVAGKILVVDGCGTAKDRWGSRGYQVNGARVLEQATTYTNNHKFWDSNTMENVLITNGWDSVLKNAAEFDFDVNISADETPYQIWYQEWSRVVPDMNQDGVMDIIKFEHDGGGTGYTNYPPDGSRYPTYATPIDFTAYWMESYGEKLQDAKQAFDMALSNNYDGLSNSDPNLPDATETPYVFINSLSGFYVDNDIYESYTPLAPNDKSRYNTSSERGSAFYVGGSKGDIPGLAADLNEDFYQYVLSKGDATGATGIVMMDFVANDLKSDNSNAGSYYLPGVIINNNRRINTVVVPVPPVSGDTSEGEEEA